MLLSLVDLVVREKEQIKRSPTEARRGTSKKMHQGVLDSEI
jgi:hypothetical protein